MSHADTAWTARATCATRPDLPWTRDRADITTWAGESMAALCRTCPVLADCLAAVDALDVTGGWWAGTDRDLYAVDPTSLVPLTWRPLLTRAGRTIGAQATLDLDGLAHLDDFGGMAAA